MSGAELERGMQAVAAELIAARARIDELEQLVATAYQLAGLVGAPVRFLDAYALHDKVDVDALLPVDLTELDEFNSLALRLEAVLKDLDEASPMRACARCGKEYRSHRMVWEEGDEMECLPCNERENARERAETDVAGSSPAERSTVAESFSPEERAIMREVADKLRAGIARRCHLCGHDTDDMDDHLTKHLF